MKINILNEMSEEVQFFVEKFKNIGWTQEDEGYITKKSDILIYPDANNQDYKNIVGIVLYPELLTYPEKGVGYVTTAWVRCRITLPFDKNIKYQKDNKIVQSVADFVKKELSKIDYKPFYDEDAFKGIFSQPQIHWHDEVEFAFYLNKDYQNGYWVNHTL